jgi:choline dehydrogenase-like flavoprotein
MTRSYDVVIIGTGMGGGTLARALKDSGLKILLLERGTRLPVEPQNQDAAALFIENRYKAKEHWIDARTGLPFKPGVHYWVGGNTKVFGAAFPRLRPQDFADLEHEGGTAPGWPISYDDLEPYYAILERWYWVHGEAGVDPTEGPRSTAFPHPPVPTDPYMADLAGRMRSNGLHPFSLPIGIDLQTGGKCIRCGTCDAFPCMFDAKGDADVCGVRPALESGNVELQTGTFVRRLITDKRGKKVTGVETVRDGASETITTGTVVVACGAVNSAALLLRSANDAHPSGLANSSDLVGRNYMVHNNAVLIAIDPKRRNPTVFQKSMAINDFYFSGPNYPFPLGNLQPVGKVRAPMLKSSVPRIPNLVLDQVASHSTDWWVMSEDLPDPENRVTLGPDGSIQVHWRPNNTVTHRKFIQVAKDVFRDAGYRVQIDRVMGIETNSHQVGTMRFGIDPATSVLDPYGKAHDLDNLYVVDASFFPSSTAVNPALTIGAQAVRVADHLLQRLGGEAVHVPAR